MRSSKKYLAIAAAIGLATATAGATDENDHHEMVKDFDFSFSPTGIEVAYYSYRGNALPDIYKRRGHGAEINLTNRPDTWDIEPDYSPDGKKIIYSSGVDMASLSLRIMNADGTEDRVFFDGDDNEVAANWSPDGNLVMFSAFNNNERTNKIYVVDRNGRHLRSLTDDLPGQSSGGSWSADGQWILFVNNPSENTQRDIYRMRADGSERTRLTHDAMSQNAPVLSPDGKMILFLGSMGDGYSDIYAMPADGLPRGASPTQLSQTDEAHEYFLTYAPDGETLVYSQGDWDTGFAMGHMPAPKPE